MSDASQANLSRMTLGERVVQAARLAVAIHLYESTRSQHDRAAVGQRVSIGGAGPTRIKEEELPSAAYRLTRTSRIPAGWPRHTRDGASPAEDRSREAGAGQ